MPDSRRFRGPHPKDQEYLTGRWVSVLQTAVSDLSWLLGHGYTGKAALKLVGDRYLLRDRQRKVLQRCAATVTACAARRRKSVEPSILEHETVVVDGYNVLLTLEAALSGGVLLLGRDGALRDLAAMSAHYRRLHTTEPALELLVDFFATHSCAEVVWYLDRPVSNSGRLKRLIQETTAGSNPPWRVVLTDRTDHLLVHSPHIVATADSAVIDGCRRWLNLSRLIVETSIPTAWILDLGEPSR